MSRPADTIDFGHRTLVVRAGRRLSLRIHGRAAAVTAVLALASLVVGVVALGSGTVTVSFVDVVRTLVSETSPQLDTLITTWRLPRVLLGLMFGAALGVGGAIFQSLTRNPLGSPDVVGFDTGAYTGAVVTIIVSGGLDLVVPGALLGGIGTALAVYLLAFKRGVQGFRLIVVGIAITFMLGSLNTYLIYRADLYTAQMAAIWGAGSLNDLAWSDVRRAVVVLGVLLVALLAVAPRMRMLELGDDAARALGMRVERDRVLLVVLAVGLTSTVTALAGPILFVSLCAPQIARRLTRAPGVQVVPSAVLGAALLVTCDIVAVTAFPAVLPVGLITVILGGAYLVWVLVAQSRKELR